MVDHPKPDELGGETGPEKGSPSASPEAGAEAQGVPEVLDDENLIIRNLLLTKELEQEKKRADHLEKLLKQTGDLMTGLRDEVSGLKTELAEMKQRLEKMQPAAPAAEETVPSDEAEARASSLLAAMPGAPKVSQTGAQPQPISKPVRLDAPSGEATTPAEDKPQNKLGTKPSAEWARNDLAMFDQRLDTLDRENEVAIDAIDEGIEGLRKISDEINQPSKEKVLEELDAAYEEQAKRSPYAGIEINFMTDELRHRKQEALARFKQNLPRTLKRITGAAVGALIVILMSSNLGKNVNEAAQPQNSPKPAISSIVPGTEDKGIQQSVTGDVVHTAAGYLTPVFGMSNEVYTSTPEKAEWAKNAIENFGNGLIVENCKNLLNTWNQLDGDQKAAFYSHYSKGFIDQILDKATRVLHDNNQL